MSIRITSIQCGAYPQPALNLGQFTSGEVSRVLSKHFFKNQQSIIYQSKKEGIKASQFATQFWLRHDFVDIWIHKTGVLDLKFYSHFDRFSKYVKTLIRRIQGILNVILRPSTKPIQYYRVSFKTFTGKGHLLNLSDTKDLRDHTILQKNYFCEAKPIKGTDPENETARLVFSLKRNERNKITFNPPKKGKRTFTFVATNRKYFNQISSDLKTAIRENEADI